MARWNARGRLPIGAERTRWPPTELRGYCRRQRHMRCMHCMRCMRYSRRPVSFNSHQPGLSVYRWLAMLHASSRLCLLVIIAPDMRRSHLVQQLQCPCRF